MSPLSHSTLFTILSLFPLLHRSAPGPCGGWNRIPDPRDKYVVDIGEFAVEEYNKKTNSQLKFGSVIKGEEQVVAGWNYRLYVTANDNGKLNNYVAVVYDKPWEKLKSLTSFDKVV